MAVALIDLMNCLMKLFVSFASMVVAVLHWFGVNFQNLVSLLVS